MDWGETAKAFDEVTKHGLERNEAMDLYTIERLSEIYNGCGPEWLPPKFRDMLTKYFYFFSAAFLVHDWDFSILPKTEKNFAKANTRLRNNCFRLVYKKVPWWNGYEILKRTRQAFIIWRVCARLGRSAFFKQPKV